MSSPFNAQTAESGESAITLNTILRDCARVVVLTHCRPDGDALGSVAALCLALTHRGQEAVAALEPETDAAPAAFVLEGVTRLCPAEAAADTGWDAVVLLDSATAERTPADAAPLLRHPRLINIDHHADNPGFGTLNWVDPSACSTGEMLCRLLLPQGLDDTSVGATSRDIAEALWVALLTDTGRFCHANTSATALRAAASLLDAAPIRTDWIADQLYGNLPLRGLRLRQRALASLEVWHAGRVAVAQLEARDFTETGCSLADVEDIIELPRALSGAQAAFLLYATDANATKVSLRTRAPLDAAAFCARFGGGGHRRAAGCTLNQSMVDAVDCLRTATADWFKA